MSGPMRTFKDLRQFCDAHDGLCRFEVHRGDRRRKHQIRASVTTQFQVCFQCARVTRKVFAGTKLSGIYKDRGDDEITIPPSCIHQTHMSRMQRPHGWHKTHHATGTTGRAYAATCFGERRFNDHGLERLTKPGLAPVQSQNTCQI